MFNSPTIVIGPPRSGTTMTARVLQERFGILMDGTPMKPHPEVNPYGWYEDTVLVTATTLLMSGVINLKAWTRRFRRFIRAREKFGRPWGFKDPRIVPVLRYALSFFDSPTIVRCHRQKELVVRSCVEKLGWEQTYAEQRIEEDERLLDTQLKDINHMRIDFTRYITEERVMQFFNSYEIIRYAS